MTGAVPRAVTYHTQHPNERGDLSLGSAAYTRNGQSFVSYIGTNALAGSLVESPEWAYGGSLGTFMLLTQ